jgi:hypothetical protein
VVIIASQALLQLAHIQQTILANSTTQLAHQGNVFAHVARELAEFGVVLHEPLHVGNGIDIHGALCLDLVLLDVFLDVLSQIAKILVHVLLEEGILVLSENNLLQLWSNVRYVAQINSPIIDAEKLVHHSLICPL